MHSFYVTKCFFQCLDDSWSAVRLRPVYRHLGAISVGIRVRRSATINSGHIRKPSSHKLNYHWLQSNCMTYDVGILNEFIVQ